MKLGPHFPATVQMWSQCFRPFLSMPSVSIYSHICSLCVLQLAHALVFIVITRFLKTARSILFLIMGIYILILLIRLSNFED